MLKKKKKTCNGKNFTTKTLKLGAICFLETYLFINCLALLPLYPKGGRPRDGVLWRRRRARNS